MATCLWSGLYGQAALGFTNAAGFPSVVTQGQAIPMSGWIKNHGAAAYTGNIDILFKRDSAPDYPLQNNVPIVGLQPGDSVLWSLNSFTFPPGILRQNNNDVLIWPTKSSGSADFDRDTTATTIYYTSYSAFRLLKSSFQFPADGVVYSHTYDFNVEAVNMSKVANTRNVRIFAKIAGHDPRALRDVSESILWHESAYFDIDGLKVLALFDIDYRDVIQQGIDEIEFFVLEDDAPVEPLNRVVVNLAWPATGASEPTLSAAEVQVFPNPTMGQVNVQLSPELMAGAEVTVFDLAGRAVHKAALRNGALDLSRLDAGSYLLQVSTRKGVYRQQVVLR